MDEVLRTLVSHSTYHPVICDLCCRVCLAVCFMQSMKYLEDSLHEALVVESFGSRKSHDLK